MAAFSSDPSKNVSSFRSSGDFQLGEKSKQIKLNSQLHHQEYSGVLCELANICDNPTSSLQNNSQNCESDFRWEVSDKLNHSYSQLDENCCKISIFIHGHIFYSN